MTSTLSSNVASAKVVPEVRDTRGRIAGIDTLRALSACFVVFGHFGLFTSANVHSANVLVRSLARVSAVCWNGPAAVIVFFVISGLCIHLPYRGKRPLNTVSFLTRRMLRVGLPAGAAFLFGTYLIHDMSGFYSVIWSVACEAIYYLIYPALRPLAEKVSWSRLFAVAYVISLIVCFLNLRRLGPGDGGYAALGYSLTWIVGLPCWILGCWLAETEQKFPVLTAPMMWLVRGGIFLLVIALRISKFHAHNLLASNCFTLNVFAVVACLWIGCEIAYYKTRPASKFLEWMGGWSYSLYLIHPSIMDTMTAVGAFWFLRSTLPSHLAALLCAFLLAYLFHLLIERPSHRVAVVLSRKVG